MDRYSLKVHNIDSFPIGKDSTKSIALIPFWRQTQYHQSLGPAQTSSVDVKAYGLARAAHMACLVRRDMIRINPCASTSFTNDKIPSEMKFLVRKSPPDAIGQRKYR